MPHDPGSEQARPGFEEPGPETDAQVFRQAVPESGATETPEQAELLIVEGAVDSLAAPSIQVALFPWVSDPEQIGAASLDANSRFFISLPWENVAYIDEVEVRLLLGGGVLLSRRLALREATREDRDGRAVRVLRVRLSTGTGCVLYGHLVLSSGSALPGADVGVFLEGRSSPLNDGRTGPDGRFAVLSDPGQIRLIVVDEHEQFLPLAKRLVVPSQPVLDLGTIPIEDGLAVGGRFEVPPEIATESIATGISLKPKGQRESFLWRGHTLCWIEDGADLATRIARADEEGRFAFSGLARRPYLLQWHPVWGSCLLGGVNRSSLEVVPPASGLLFRAGESFAYFSVMNEAGRSIADAELEFSTTATGQTTVRATKEGRLLACIRPGERYSITIRAPHHETEHLVVEAPLSGVSVHDVRLRATNQRSGTLILIVRGSDPGRLVDEIELDLVSARRPSEPHVSRRSTSPDGRHVLPDIPADRYSLFVEPASRLSGYDVPATLDVVVAPGAERAYEVDLEAGGRIEVSIHDAAGVLLPAECEVFDAFGQHLSVEFLSYDEGGNTHFLSPDLPHPPGAVEPFSRVRNALDAGRYRLVAQLQGYSPAEAIALVRLRETVRVDLELQPRK